jgi:cell division protein FtsI (penicillin-binding protein 3)
VGAVHEGTGKSALIPHYEIAGKTGTAQRVSPKGGYEGYISSFIGFPVNVNRRFVVMAYVEAPTKNGYYGGAVAAPIFRKITQYILYKKKDFAQFAKYNEKSNQKNLDEVSVQMSSRAKFSATETPSFIGMDKSSALELAEKRQMKVEMYGFGIVKKQSVEPGSALNSELTVKLYFEAPSYVE